MARSLRRPEGIVSRDLSCTCSTLSRMPYILGGMGHTQHQTVAAMFGTSVGSFGTLNKRWLCRSLEKRVDSQVAQWHMCGLRVLRIL